LSTFWKSTVEMIRSRRADVGADQTPVVIFGTGGSGTRVVQVLAARAGCFMGTHLNAPGDSLDVGRFLGRWVNRYLARSNWVEEMCRGSSHGMFGYSRRMADEFRLAIESHRSALDDPEAPWGWKAPRTIFILPFVHEMYPAVKVVHLVRDGRDMAYSQNQSQMRLYGRRLLPEADLELHKPIRSIKFWARVNLAAANYGAQFINGNYLRLRYEDLCSDPGEAAVRLLDFLDSPASRESMRAVAAEVVQPRPSTPRARTGRRPSWREKKGENPLEVEEVQRAGADALREFEYL
jgi:hypothetical protein